LDRNNIVHVLHLVVGCQIHAYRHRNIFLMEYVPYTLFALGIITILGGLAWFAVTMINMNAGFLTKETFLLERLRFRGNAFKELKYREESFRLVTSGRVPPRVFILTAFINQ
jgi:NADH:ubiquinone oxidoreductase subunit 5 (subunit L)/multisubunit Na+/H+ antiporter MnhA subunit